MKTTSLTAVVLCCAAAATAQPVERSVNDNYMYTYRASPRFSTSTVRTYEPAHGPSYNNVKPPLPDLDIARKNYPVNNQTGSVIIHPSGTTLYIPQNAFADENGNLVEGNVTVSYREFKNPVEFMLAGYPHEL